MRSNQQYFVSKLFFKILLIFIFSTPFDIYSQTIESSVKSDLSNMIKKSSSKQDKKVARKFLKLISTEHLSSQEKSKIIGVLEVFKLRKCKFNVHYVHLFNIVTNQKNNVFISRLLDFINSHHSEYTKLELGVLLKRIDNILVFKKLNNQGHFVWGYNGDIELDFFDGLVGLQLSSVDLNLSNSVDTVQLFNVSGFFNIMSTKLKASNGEARYFSDDWDAYFIFHDFEIDINKSFFNIKNSTISTNGIINTICSGTYKNKLTSSELYPAFKSNNDNISLDIFNKIHLTTGVELKGNSAFFNRSGRAIEVSFIHNTMKYFFVSNHFELKERVLYSSVSRFSMTDNKSFLEHPYVNITYYEDQQRILIERLNGKRGLNPIRNSFHGLNMFADRIDIDLTNNSCVFFHFSKGRDMEVLFESNKYFDIGRYTDFVRHDLNPISLLLDFMLDRNPKKEHTVLQFANFSNINIQTALNLIIDMEVLGFLDYNRFGDKFIVNQWLFEFRDAIKEDYDYDNFKIQSLAAIGDSVAKFNFDLNTLEIYGVQGINITNRFLFNLYPMSNKLTFFDDKSFSMDGNISIGNFAFSGKELVFNYENFAFYFSHNSLLSFITKEDKQTLSSSLIHFDKGVLYVDSMNNKSGVHENNNFPKFKVNNKCFLSYKNDPVVFLIHPFSITYLQDMSLSNLTFPGDLYLDGEVCDASGVLGFNSTHNLQTYIEQDSINLFKNNIRLNGALRLNEKGLFASGKFSSNYIEFDANNLQIFSGKMLGFVNHIKSSSYFQNNTFLIDKAILNYSPYDSTFLIKSGDGLFQIYNKFNFSGDLYYDGENLNGSGHFKSKKINMKSSHYYFDNEDIVSADVDFELINSDQLGQLRVKGSSVEYHVSDNSVFVSKSNHTFNLPEIQYSLDFDYFLLNLNENQILFQNNVFPDYGDCKTYRYGKKYFSYKSLNAQYNLDSSELCLNGGIQLDVGKFWIQPQNNGFCVLANGDFPVFSGATLIKKRKFFKDKLINNKNVIIKSSLKPLIILD